MFTAVRFCTLVLLASTLRAGDPPAVDADLPQPLDAGAVGELLTHPPFTRIVNLEDTIQLTGIAYVDGKPVATFLNKSTKEHVTISEEPNSRGWKITEAIPGTEPQDTEVHVMIEGEVVTMHYGDAQLEPGGSKKGVPIAHVTKSGGAPSVSSKGDEHVRTSSYLGDNGRELYTSLSREGRDKFKDAIHAYVEKHPDRTPEQTSAVAQKIYAKIKATDQNNGGSDTKSSGKTPKPGKTPKNR